MYAKGDYTVALKLKAFVCALFVTRKGNKWHTI